MNRTTTVAACILGALFLILALIYATHSAGTLPHFLPGYQAGSTRTHIKHGLACFLLAVASFVYAWFQSGPKSSSAAVSTEKQ